MHPQGSCRAVARCRVVVVEAQHFDESISNDSFVVDDENTKWVQWVCVHWWA